MSRVVALEQRLKAARKRRRLTQAQLADRMGLPTSSIGQFECGARQPSATNLVRLANALGVSTDYLLGRRDS